MSTGAAVDAPAIELLIGPAPGWKIPWARAGDDAATVSAATSSGAARPRMGDLSGLVKI